VIVVTAAKDAGEPKAPAADQEGMNNLSGRGGELGAMEHEIQGLNKIPPRPVTPARPATPEVIQVSCSF